MIKLPKLHEAADAVVQAAWRPVLKYVAELHERSVRDDTLGLFPHPWEEIGPGYVFGPAFGHWDITHACLDTLAHEPEHAARQIENLLALQQRDGRLPVVMMVREGKPWLHEPKLTHPPVWPTVVDALLEVGVDLRADVLGFARRQLAWFDAHRRAGDAYAYADLVIPGSFESGIDDGVRFLGDDLPRDRLRPFVDASCHVWLLLDAVARWGDDAEASRRADALAHVVRETMWSGDAGFFFDPHHLNGRQPAAFEGMWPVVVGIASEDQADRVIDEWLLNSERFFATHPIRTVAASGEGYEMRMWRGPAWNSMTLWACRGCLKYGRVDAAVRLSRAALDATAKQFDQHGTIFEFYHPDGASADTVARKPYNQQHANEPSRDYLGHNPLLALWRIARG